MTTELIDVFKLLATMFFGGILGFMLGRYVFPLRSRNRLQ